MTHLSHQIPCQFETKIRASPLGSNVSTREFYPGTTCFRSFPVISEICPAQKPINSRIPPLKPRLRDKLSYPSAAVILRPLQDKKHIFFSTRSGNLLLVTLINPFSAGPAVHKHQYSSHAITDINLDNVCKKGNTLLWDLVQDEDAV